MPQDGELRFDTFAVLVERMGLRDTALVAIGPIIHDLDLHDDRFGRDETARVRSIIDGICTVLKQRRKLSKDE